MGRLLAGRCVIEEYGHAVKIKMGEKWPLGKSECTGNKGTYCGGSETKAQIEKSESKLWRD